MASLSSAKTVVRAAAAASAIGNVGIEPPVQPVAGGFVWPGVGVLREEFVARPGEVVHAGSFRLQRWQVKPAPAARKSVGEPRETG